MAKQALVQENTFLAINEYHKMEIQEIFLRTGTLENIRTQMATFCLTANITVLGFAFSTQKAVLVFAATIILLLWALADFAGRRNIGALYYRGLQLEKLYAPDKDSALLHIYVASTSTRRRWVKQLSDIIKIKNSDAKIKALRAFRFSFTGFVLPIIGVILEILLGLFLLTLRWSLF
jgi:hypothetical protein